MHRYTTHAKCSNVDVLEDPVEIFAPANPMQANHKSTPI